MSNVQAHSLTIRLPETLYRAARKTAQREGVSLNRLVADALAERSRRSVARRLREAYDTLGREGVGSEVEGFMALQAEALLDG